MEAAARYSRPLQHSIFAVLANCPPLRVAAAAAFLDDFVRFPNELERHSLRIDDGKMAGVKAAVPRVSYADMERWPEDGRRYELYDGEVFEIPSPLPIHQVVLGRLHLALSGYVRAHGGVVVFAPLDIVLTEYDVVQPDLLLFTRERQHL